MRVSAIERDIGHWWFQGLVVGLLLATASPVSAQEATGTMFDDKQDGAASLAVTNCVDDSWVECVSHDLSCESTSPLKLYVAGDFEPEGRLAEIVRDLLKGGYGNARLMFRTGDKGPGIALPVYEIELSQNDMNGTWDASFLFGDREPLFDAITDSTKSLVAIVGDKTLEFAPRPEDAPKLQKFKEACLAKGG